MFIVARQVFDEDYNQVRKGVREEMREEVRE